MNWGRYERRGVDETGQRQEREHGVVRWRWHAGNLKIRSWQVESRDWETGAGGKLRSGETGVGGESETGLVRSESNSN